MKITLSETEHRYKFASYEPSIITIYNAKGDADLKEPSLIAADAGSDAITGIGLDVNYPIGRHGDFLVGSPFKDGLVADFDLAHKVLRHFLIKAKRRRIFLTPKTALFVPLDLTPVQHKLLTELFFSLGAGNPLIIEDTFKNVFQSLQPSKGHCGGSLFEIIKNHREKRLRVQTDLKSFKIIVEITPNQPHQPSQGPQSRLVWRSRPVSDGS